MRQKAKPALTPLAIAILALLEERPMHPYEMQQLLVNRCGDELIKVRTGSLYHTVVRLAGRKLVSTMGIDREGSRPERTVYGITDVGRKALRDKVATALREPAREYPLLPVALAQAHVLPNDYVLELLRDRIEHLTNDLASADTRYKSTDSNTVPRRQRMALQYLRAMIAAELRWVQNMISDLNPGADLHIGVMKGGDPAPELAGGSGDRTRRNPSPAFTVAPDDQGAAVGTAQPPHPRASTRSRQH